MLIHLPQFQFLVVRGAGGARDAEEEFRVPTFRCRSVEALSELCEQLDVVLRLRGIGGVLPIDIQAIEAVVLEQLHGGAREGRAAGGGGCRGGEVGGVGPPADGEEGFEVTVAALEEGELFEAAVEVGAGVVPGVGGVVFVCVGWGSVNWGFLAGGTGRTVEDMGHVGVAEMD